MKGLVTIFGGSGFVGGQAVRALAKAGWRIRVAVRRPGMAHRLRMLGDVGQIEIVQANIRNVPSVERALAGAEAVVNAVGQAFETGRQGFMAVHVMGARNMAQAAAAAGISNFVQLSGIGADPESPIKYARARGEGEAAVREAIPTAVILRPAMIFGPDDVYTNRLSALATLSPVVPMFGGGAAKVAPVYVADVAAAVAAALSDPAARGRTYELEGPTTYTAREVSEILLREIGRERFLVPVPTPLAHLIGQAFEIPTKILGIPPILTGDQALLLAQDNVAAEGAPGLADLGVTPTAMEGVIGTYLYRYRKGGQYAEQSAAAAAR